MIRKNKIKFVGLIKTIHPINPPKTRLFKKTGLFKYFGIDNSRAVNKKNEYTWDIPISFVE